MRVVLTIKSILTHRFRLYLEAFGETTSEAVNLHNSAHQVFNIFKHLQADINSLS